MSRRLTTAVRDAVVVVSAKTFDVSGDEILGIRRTSRISQARQYTMWLLREMGFSFPEIGRQLKRDHASVIFGVRAHEARVAEGVFSSTPRRMPVENPEINVSDALATSTNLETLAA